MRYCPNCGSQLAEEVRFCPTCGTEQQTGQQPVRRTTGARKRLHCPNCRSTNLTSILESTGSIGSVGRISRNIALTGTSINNKSFWMCQECGHKFRNLEDLIQENKKYLSTYSICVHVFFVLLSMYAIFWILITRQLSGTIGCLAAVAISYGIFRWDLKRQKNKRAAEEKRLRKGCFD